MRRFGWIRLACLFLALTVLTALVRLGDTGAEARSLAARVPDVISLTPEEPQASEPEEPAVTQWTEAQISSFQDVSEEALRAQGASRPADPGVRDEAEKKSPAGKMGRAASPPEPPVFYRPVSPGEPAVSGPVCGDLSGTPEGGRIVFPLQRQFFFSYEDTWGAPRTQGGHEGTDLMTPSGVPEYAITDGTVVPVAGSDADGWNTLGGHAVMVRADYSIGPVKAGDLFYYAHLERESPLEIGDRVSAGQVVGYAGDTGQGPPGTSGLFPPHLHLGWYDGTGGREEAGSGAMNPFPLLEWIRANGGAVSGRSDARFCEAPRSGPPTPSAHAGPWPSPEDPNLSPDLDTGSGNAKPARASREDDREADAPAKKQPEPDGPKKPRNDPPHKHPDENRPRSPEPDRPDSENQRPARPDAGGDDHPPQKHETPEKDPPNDDLPEDDTPEPSPTDDQYDDPSTREPSGTSEAPRSNDAPKPKTHQQHDAEGSETTGEPSQQEPPHARADDRNP